MSGVDRHPLPRIALLTQGITGGGVATVACWLRGELLRTGRYQVDVLDLACSSRDRNSRRLVDPRSWFRRSLRSVERDPVGHEHWGGNAVEIEPMRYRPRRELTAALRGYDLIQVVAGGPATAAAALRAHRPVVLQVATTVRWERRSRAADRWALRAWRSAMTAATGRVERRTLRRVAAVLVENDEMLRYVRAVGQPQVRVAPPGVDTDVFRPAPDGWHRHGPLLSICRLSDPRKGLDRLVRAYAELRARLPDAPPLVLAGHGTLPGRVSDLVTRLGLSAQVSVRSDVARAELVRLYQGASVFVQASHEEGLGLSSLEAMACGVPVVATETAGSRQVVVPGGTGFLVDQRVAGRVIVDLAERIRQALADGERLAAGSRERCVTRYASRRTLELFLETYDRLLTTRGDTPPRPGLDRPAAETRAPDRVDASRPGAVAVPARTTDAH